MKNSIPFAVSIALGLSLVAGVAALPVDVPAAEARSPEVEIRNLRSEEVEVFWIPVENQRSPQGTIEPGGLLTITSTFGHRFVVEAGEFRELFEVEQDGQVVVLLDESRQATRAALTSVPGYQPREVGGWLVMVSEELLREQPDATEHALELLEGQCRRVIDALVAAPDALEAVLQVPLWFSPAYEGTGQKAEYHPDGDWLAKNGRIPELVRCVEFTNIPILEKEIRRMPMLLLHELAHAYHHQVLGFEHKGIMAAHREALLTRRYDSVERRGSKKPQKAYAITNHKEYFAETTEAYFGQNDFYPFNRPELLEHDPRMFQVLAKVWEGREATIEPEPTTYEVTAPPAELGVDSFYAKYVSAGGYPVVASEKVDDYALKEAAWLIDRMLAQRPDVRDAMIHSGSRLIIMAHDEFTTDMPEHSDMRPKPFWDARARGLGGSQSDPVCSCGEENLLGYPGDPYSTENILIHEFAHNIHLRGMVRVDATFNDRLREAYDAAMAAGLWAGKYAASNPAEYFAEGVQSWFGNNREPDHDHNHVNTRAELVDYDPGLAALCEEVFGATELVYTKPAERLTGHLEGYDPAQAPEFVWPQRLIKVKDEIRRKARLRSDAGETSSKAKGG